MALVEYYGCLPPVFRQHPDPNEPEPHECELCGEVYFRSTQQLLDKALFGLPGPHEECPGDPERPMIRRLSIHQDGPLRWDLLAPRDRPVPWWCWACGEDFEASLRALLRGEAHDRTCWTWWARYWVHPKVARSDDWRGRSRRDGCAYLERKRGHGRPVRADRRPWRLG